MNAFDSIKDELIRRGYDRAEADAQSAAYTRMLDDNATVTEEETIEACDQIDSME